MTDFLTETHESGSRRNKAREAAPVQFLALQSLIGNRAASRIVQRVSGTEVSRNTTRPHWPDRRNDSTVVMRYLAGQSGHGGIEAEALGAGGAGFNEADVNAIYRGNWMRDFSQMPHTPEWHQVLETLAIGEFGSGTSDDELGGYVASEHMDNPEGGSSIENPEVRADRVRLAAALEALSPDQRAAYQREEDASVEIANAAAISGLPIYIERAKFHARDKLDQAVRNRQSAEGMRAMGDALHAIEDYFSHSNYVEACIYLLRDDPAIQPLVTRLHATHLGANMAMLVPQVNGEIQIQTGTYAPGANELVSQFETIENECLHGELRAAFLQGCIRRAGIGGEELGRRLGTQAGTTVGANAGFAVGAAAGAISGLGTGIESGFHRGRGVWGTIEAVAEDAASASSHEMVSEGTTTGSNWGRIAGGIGGGIGSGVGMSIAAIIAEFGVEAVLKVVDVTAGRAVLAAARSGLIEWIVEHETAQSGGEARQLGLSGPTHSELAKDGPGHQLYGASRTLAVVADREIGTAMRAAWAIMGSPGSASTTPSAAVLTAASLSVTSLVDKFVSHPQHDRWWEPTIRSVAASSGP